MTSYFCDVPAPNAPVYTSSSAFEDVFSETLGFENEDMDILTVKHMPVKTQRNRDGANPNDIVEGVFHDLG